MLGSRRLADFCCLTLAQVLTFCLDQQDLERLGSWRPERHREGYSPGVWCRGLLQRRCQEDRKTARAVGDLLDLAYLDTIFGVREMSSQRLEETVERWLAGGDGRALPALLWALTSDPRDDVARLGARLGHEAQLRACTDYVSGANGGAPAIRADAT